MESGYCSGPSDSEMLLKLLGTVIGVHLGNTKSFVAGYNDTAAAAGFKICIPSWVALADDGALLVGEAAKKRGAENPEAAAFGFKRLFGKEFSHEDVRRLAERVPYNIVERVQGVGVELTSNTTGVAERLGVSSAGAMVVAHLKAYLGRKVHDAVAIVPHYFHNEPTAAAVSHGVHRRLRDGGNVLVLHVGGGTTYAAVLGYADGAFRGRGQWHDAHLGGDDFDRRVVDHFVEVVRKKHGVDVSDDGAAMGKLRAECERAKKELSSRDAVRVEVESLLGGVRLSEPLTRAEFEELNRDLFRRVAAVAEMAAAGGKEWRNTEMIDEVVLVGGSARIPMIQRLIGDYFEGKKTITVGEPDEAVVYGGALLGHPSGGGYRCTPVQPE